jgi:hypothetical protein
MTQQKIVLALINLFIFGLLTFCGIVWALPMAKAGDWFSVALVALCISAVWQVVKGGAQ